jgi:hypothetical protein
MLAAKAKFWLITMFLTGSDTSNLSNKERIKLLNQGTRGVRIRIPIMFIMKNWMSCFVSGLVRDLGYVQYRFHKKLLVTAQMKDTPCAQTRGTLNTRRRRFIIPKSTMVPVIPTNENFKKRILSRLLFNILINLIYL